MGAGVGAGAVSSLSFLISMIYIAITDVDTISRRTSQGEGKGGIIWIFAYASKHCVGSGVRR